jgi:hypothetical protein
VYAAHPDQPLLGPHACCVLVRLARAVNAATGEELPRLSKGFEPDSVAAIVLPGTKLFALEQKAPAKGIAGAHCGTEVRRVGGPTTPVHLPCFFFADDHLPQLLAQNAIRVRPFLGRPVIFSDTQNR